MPTILVVDDDEFVRRYMARVLEDGGHKVLLAGDGLEALDLLAREAPAIHVVVTDVLMPRLTGPELAARLAEQLSAPPVLFVSGGHYRSDVAGPTLRKPFLPGDLREMVRLVLMRDPAHTTVLESCG